MKKLLLTTALVGVAFVASPAMAEVELGLGGHFKGYVTWNDQDDIDVVGAQSDESRNFDIVRDTEIHFTGETTLDNGLTVGFHAETEADGNDDMTIQESYAYFAGNWGRVNFGAEDGAAYLLQVAAPAADSNVDGIRQYINPINYTVLDDGALLPGGFGQLDYAQDVSGYADKLTYISPVFNGFQAGFSFAPQATYADDLVDGVRTSDDEDDLENIWEAAARYEGQFNAVRVALGAGYSHAGIEDDATVPDNTDDQNSWNLGANFGFGPFNVGGAYVTDNNGTAGSFDTDTWVLGVDYTTGPFVIGASYLDRQDENGGAGGDDVDTQRYSGGVTYTYGPGMTFRGSVHHVSHDLNTAGQSDPDATSLLLGTQIGF